MAHAHHSRPMNEMLVVYAFLDVDGQEQEFVTLDTSVAAQYAANNDYEVIERLFEYRLTRTGEDMEFDPELDGEG